MHAVVELQARAAEWVAVRVQGRTGPLAGQHYDEDQRRISRNQHSLHFDSRAMTNSNQASKHRGGHRAERENDCSSRVAGDPDRSL